MEFLNPASAANAVKTRRPRAIVGIGASAGGLEALETFFDHAPADSGLAYVVVQHLSPDFKSLMDELLSRHTKIRIHRVVDGMEVEPNSIYLIPAKKEMIVSGGRLLLTDKDPAQPLTLPIDVFLRSLAQEMGNRAVGVVLSGTGSDGSRGIRAIHEAGGLVFAQDPDTAKFDGMPKSAVDTGVVDYVLPPEQIVGAILHNVDHPDSAEGLSTAGTVSEEGMNVIFRILRDEYGIDFSHYKQSTVMRRVERRLQLNQSFDLDDYIACLRDDSREVNSLYKDLLIGVTEFFRDTEAFDRLEKDVIPQLLERVSPRDELRIWVAGCGTGEEAYSIAILLDEALARRSHASNAKVFATDVHRASLEFASAGVYEPSSVARVSSDRLGRYFTCRNGHYHVSQDLRKTIVFAPHNVIKDAPFTKLDLISCRNLLIYLQPLAQKKVLSLFHFGLKAGGVMFLGPSESPGDIADEFETIDSHWKIFRKRRDIRLPADIRLPLASGYPLARHHATPLAPAGSGYPDMELLRAYDALLAEYVPPSLLLNSQRQLVHTFGGAGRFIAPRDGRVSSDVLEMVDKELKLVLAGALQRAARDLVPVIYTGVRIETAQGEEEVKVRVSPISARDSSAPYMLVSLESVASQRTAWESQEEVDFQQASEAQLRSLEVELRYTKENLQATIEELETSNEELQATNEELVASNEELQSTNEELHSVNEELYTVNAEHQRKIAQLTQLTSDMDNLLESIDVGTVFLDRELCIRKFTPRITSVFHILPQDVGRRIDSFASNIDYQGLVGDIAAVLESESPQQCQVRDRHGRWYLLRLLPYHSGPRVEGVVVTLIDLAPLKEAEAELRLMSKVFQDAADPIIIEDLSGKILYVNEEAERAYGWSRQELLGHNVTMLLPEEERKRSESLRRRCVSAEGVRNIETTRRTKSGHVYPVLLTFSLLTNDRDEPVAIASIAKDITSQKRAEANAQEEVLRRDRFLAILSHELRNPLSAVLNAAYVLDARSRETPEIEEPCRVIQRQAQQMSRLLDDLLDVSRVTQGRIDIRFETCDLRRAIESAVEVMRPQIDARDLTFDVDAGPEPLLVNGDLARLQQITVNLLTNAMKYTPAGGSIRLTAAYEQDQVVLRVRDTGEGIPENMRESIFDMFVQAGGTLDRSDGGMGVGLTLVRSLVEMQNGSISAHSDGPGKGSVFVVRLPRCCQPQSSRAAPAVEPSTASAGRILIIEDNADSREMLRSLLEIDGYRVDVAEDGRRGLELLKRDHFATALVDIGLPGMDGYQVAREIRRDPKHAGIRLVALTGYGRSTDREAARDAGFDEHLVKPLKPKDLARILGNPQR
jgi:two-component system CheB/CheR fusion protein